MTLFQYFRLQERDVALLEVDDDRAGDVLTFIGAHRHHRRQTPLHATTSQLTSAVNSIPNCGPQKRESLLFLILPKRDRYEQLFNALEIKCLCTLPDKIVW